ERFVRMENAEQSATFWSVASLELMRVWQEMERRNEEPVVMYYSQSCAGAELSKTSLQRALEKPTHYLVVSTFEQTREEYRSYRVRDGVAVPEEIVVIDGTPDWR
ncbi:MAG: peptidase, partial [Catenulispora sp.]